MRRRPGTHGRSVGTVMPGFVLLFCFFFVSFLVCGGGGGPGRNMSQVAGVGQGRVDMGYLP